MEKKRARPRLSEAEAVLVCIALEELALATTDQGTLKSLISLDAKITLSAQAAYGMKFRNSGRG